jgi:hypothetical protein
MGEVEGDVCPGEGEGPSRDERGGSEEVVGVDESSLGCEEEARLAPFPFANHKFYADGRLNTRTFAVNTYTGSPC